MVTTTLLLLGNHSRLGTSAAVLHQSLLHVIGRVNIYGQERAVRPRAHQKIKEENISIFVNMDRKRKKNGHKTTCSWKNGKRVCKKKPSYKPKSKSWGTRKPKKRPDTPLPESDLKVEENMMKSKNPRFL